MDPSRQRCAGRASVARGWPCHAVAGWLGNDHHENYSLPRAQSSLDRSAQKALGRRLSRISSNWFRSVKQRAILPRPPKRQRMKSNSTHGQLLAAEPIATRSTIYCGLLGNTVVTALCPDNDTGKGRVRIQELPLIRALKCA
jgi:hypothetical protein